MGRGSSALVLAEGCWGALLLIAPGRLLGALAGGRIDARVSAIARVLGAREVVQALATGRRPTRRRLHAGALVDGAHAASMVALAASGVGPRRLTLTSAATATAFAAAGIAESRVR